MEKLEESLKLEQILFNDLKFDVIPSSSLSNEDKCTLGPAVAFAEIAPESGFNLLTTPITLRPLGAVPRDASEKVVA